MIDERHGHDHGGGDHGHSHGGRGGGDDHGHSHGETEAPDHGHSHGGKPCHGHGPPPEAKPQHGHSHNGIPCTGHGGPRQERSDFCGCPLLDIEPQTVQLMHRWGCQHGSPSLQTMKNMLAHPVWSPYGAGPSIWRGVILGALLYAGLHGIFYRPHLWNWYVCLVLVALHHLQEFYLPALLTPFESHYLRFSFQGRTKWDMAAKLCAVVEFWLEWFFFGSVLSTPMFKWLAVLGTVIALLALYVRCLAHYTLGPNYTEWLHYARFAKGSQWPRLDFQFVTKSIYRYIRHPGYASYFWFCVGLELILLNPVSLLLHIYVLIEWFTRQCDHEEGHMMRNYGERYLQYHRRTFSGIPLMGMPPPPVDILGTPTPD
eukprot:gb/GEZN01007437.1/.p1 GENE.gb/GEZN01007437.1/~~gb/GEZN01007437.1/.p1  ORF type:complete len:413 (-),score=30.76 gb/GEZN01007437.1/:299-1414(-)